MTSTVEPAGATSTAQPCAHTNFLIRATRERVETGEAYDVKRERNAQIGRATRDEMQGRRKRESERRTGEGRIRQRRKKIGGEANARERERESERQDGREINKSARTEEEC